MAYVPTGMDSRSTGLAHQMSTYYTSRALDQLRTTFRFKDVCQSDMIPKRNGRSIQWFRWDKLSAQTTPSVDGTVPTSGTVSNNIVGAELSQFSAFLSASDLLVATQIDNVIEAMSDQLGYQAGQTVDRLTRDQIDAFSGSVTVSLFSTYPTAQDLRGGVAILQGFDALPLEDGDYRYICHPYTWFDIINDPAANGYADIFKHTTTNTAMKDNADVRKDAVGRFAGVKIQTTTNVKVTSGTPNTYRSYMFARNGIGCASLEGWKPSDVTDPNSQKFKINVIPGGRPDKTDPTGEIGGMVSYKFAYVVTLLDGPDGIGGNFRYRVWENPTLLGL